MWSSLKLCNLSGEAKDGWYAMLEAVTGVVVTHANKRCFKNRGVNRLEVG